jgi:hypothetical protein
MAITSLSTSSLVSGVKRRRVWDQTATTDGFFQIATTTLNTTASSITFSSIPQDYTHLQIRGILRSTRAENPNDPIQFRFNSDTASNYSSHNLTGNGAAAESGVDLGTSILEGRVTGPTATASTFSAEVIDILDYANTNKYKTVRWLNAHDRNGAGQVKLLSGNWRNTAAITSITFSSVTASNFVQYSSLALYGIKG